MNDEFFSSVYNASLDIISRREHSEQEITKKLLKKFDTPEVIDRVITKLVANNLIDDVRYTQMYVLARKRKGFGPKTLSFSSKNIHLGVSNIIDKIICNEFCYYPINNLWGIKFL